MEKKKVIIVSTVGLIYDGITSVILSYEVNLADGDDYEKILEQMVQDAEMRREQHRNILLDLLEKTEAVSSLLYEKHLSREKMGEVVMQLSNRIRLELNQ